MRFDPRSAAFDRIRGWSDHWATRLFGGAEVHRTQGRGKRKSAKKPLIIRQTREIAFSSSRPLESSTALRRCLSTLTCCFDLCGHGGTLWWLLIFRFSLASRGCPSAPTGDRPELIRRWGKAPRFFSFCLLIANATLSLLQTSPRHCEDDELEVSIRPFAVDGETSSKSEKPGKPLLSHYSIYPE